MKVLLAGIAVISVMAFSFAGCDSGKKDNSTLLLLMAKSRIEAQAKATAVSSSVSGSMSSMVAPAGSLHAFNKAMDQQKMMIAILNNGNDPVFAKEAVSEYIAQQRMVKAVPQAQLASLTVEPPVEGSGTKTYIFSGTIDGVGKTAAPPIIIPLLCTIELNTPNGTQGTLEFGAGSTLAWTGLTGADPSTGSFSGHFAMNSNLTYSNFGFFYTNYVAIMQMVKHPSIMSACAAANSFAQYAIVQSGSVIAGMTADYTGTATTNSFASSSNFQVNLDSPEGIVILPNGTGDPRTVTLEDVSYNYSSNISVTQAEDMLSTISGSLTVTFTGTVNGNTIDETIAINL